MVFILVKHWVIQCKKIRLDVNKYIFKIVLQKFIYIVIPFIIQGRKKDYEKNLSINSN